MTTLEIVDGSIAVLERDGWGRGMDSYVSGPGQPTCILGSLVRATGAKHGDRSDEHLSALAAIGVEVGLRGCDNALTWNDEKCKDAAEAIALLKAVRARVLATEEQR